jgi:hypothetical protein
MHPPNAKAAQAVDETREVVLRMIVAVGLAGRAQGHEAVGPAVKHDMDGRIAQILGEFLNVLFGPPAPMMRDMKDGFRVRTYADGSGGYWRRVQYRTSPLADRRSNSIVLVAPKRHWNFRNAQQQELPSYGSTASVAMNGCIL